MKPKKKLAKNEKKWMDIEAQIKPLQKSVWDDDRFNDKPTGYQKSHSHKNSRLLLHDFSQWMATARATSIVSSVLIIY